jgi:hypothetical protein
VNRDGRLAGGADGINKGRHNALGESDELITLDRQRTETEQTLKQQNHKKKHENKTPKQPEGI